MEWAGTGGRTIWAVGGDEVFTVLQMTACPVRTVSCTESTRQTRVDALHTRPPWSLHTWSPMLYGSASTPRPEVSMIRVLRRTMTGLPRVTPSARPPGACLNRPQGVAGRPERYGMTTYWRSKRATVPTLNVSSEALRHRLNKGPYRCGLQGSASPAHAADMRKTVALIFSTMESRGIKRVHSARGRPEGDRTRFRNFSTLRKKLVQNVLYSRNAR